MLYVTLRWFLDSEATSSPVSLPKLSRSQTNERVWISLLYFLTSYGGSKTYLYLITNK